MINKDLTGQNTSGKQMHLSNHSCQVFWAVTVMALGAVAALAGCASQQDVIALNNRIARLEQRNLELEHNKQSLQERVENLTKSRSGQEQDIRSQSADLRTTLVNIQEEMGALSGKMEETEYALKQKLKGAESIDSRLEATLKRLEDLTTANRDRISRLEGYLGLEPSEKAAAPVKGDSPVSKELSEDDLYMLAKQKFSNGELETSRKFFEEFISKYPKSGYADNSRFWIGEIYFQEKWYEKAILEYQQVIEKYPQGNKVPAALLKQGLAFYMLGDKANAKLILKELIRKYPGSNEAKIADQKLREFG
jgi:tol-pal system protein YbgF